MTWYKRSSKRKHDDLRGCLGTFSQELPIAIGLKKYAVMSAMNDKRFSPILVEELSALKCQISLLHSFTRCKSWDDWDLGTHGITIQFEAPPPNGGVESTGHSKKHSKGSGSGHCRVYNATYLPEVARQQRWNRVQTIDHLVAKAGYNGTASTVHKLVVTKYQSCKHSMSWSEFVEYSKSDRVLIGRVGALRTITTPQCYAGMTGKEAVVGVQLEEECGDGMDEMDGNKRQNVGGSTSKKRGRGKSSGCSGLYGRSSSSAKNEDEDHRNNRHHSLVAFI